MPDIVAGRHPPQTMPAIRNKGMGSVASRPWVVVTRRHRQQTRARGYTGWHNTKKYQGSLPVSTIARQKWPLLPTMPSGPAPWLATPGDHSWQADITAAEWIRHEVVPALSHPAHSSPSSHCRCRLVRCHPPYSPAGVAEHGGKNPPAQAGHPVPARQELQRRAGTDR